MRQGLGPKKHDEISEIGRINILSEFRDVVFEDVVVDNNN